jgi:predicted permease
MLARLLVRLEAFVFRRTSDAELDEELSYHLEREIERNVARGMDPIAARDAARRAFGNITVVTEQARDAARWRRLEELRQDIGYTLRTFRRAPLFVLTVVATIGLGLGLLSAAFTFFDAYALRSLAVRDPHSLYEVGWSSANGRKHHFSPAQFQQLRQDRTVVSEAFAYANVQARLRAHSAIGQTVSPNFFSMLGVPPALGRALVPSDSERPDVVVLSHRSWTSAFGADSNVLGSRINLNGSFYTVVGIARDGFGGLTSAPFDFWLPLSNDALVSAIVRLAPGVSENRAHTALLARIRGMTADLPPLERAASVTLIPKGTSIPVNDETIAIFAPVVMAFALVLLIACANVANIMLARGMARQREIGIRLALGAGRRRLVRQLVTEAIVLALPAGMLGYVVSRATIWISLRVMFLTVPPAYAGFLRVIPMDAGARVLAFVLLSAIGAALAFGLIPALQATRPDIVHASRGDFDTRFRPSRLRNALVITQVTFSVLLLISAGILLSGARRTATLDPGIRTQNVVQVSLLPQFRARAIERLKSEPGVLGMATSTATVLDGRFSEFSVSPSGAPSQRASYNVVSPDYFSVVGLPVLAGRGFTDDEALSADGVAIVSRSTAERFWPGQSPVGKTLTIPTTDRDFQYLRSFHTARVIGVTRDAVPGSLNESATLPTVYYPLAPDADVNRILVRVAGESEQAVPMLERLLAAVDSAAVVEMHSLDSALALQVYPFRAMYWVATALGAIALMLTLIGVYGVLSYVVAQRRREFGIRLALGAAGSTLAGMVLRQSLRLSLAGVAIGATLAMIVSQLLSSVMLNIHTFDAVGYAGGIGLVLVACVAAAYAPSRRAATVNPVDALRADS